MMISVNNCSACIAVCPTDALSLTVKFQDVPFQGPGHLGHAHRRQDEDETVLPQETAS